MSLQLDMAQLQFNQVLYMSVKSGPDFDEFSIHRINCFILLYELVLTLFQNFIVSSSSFLIDSAYTKCLTLRLKEFIIEKIFWEKSNTNYSRVYQICFQVLLNPKEEQLGRLNIVVEYEKLEVIKIKLQFTFLCKQYITRLVSLNLNVKFQRRTSTK